MSNVLNIFQQKNMIILVIILYDPKSWEFCCTFCHIFLRVLSHITSASPLNISCIIVHDAASCFSIRRGTPGTHYRHRHSRLDLRGTRPMFCEHTLPDGPPVNTIGRSKITDRKEKERSFLLNVFTNVADTAARNFDREYIFHEAKYNTF